MVAYVELLHDAVLEEAGGVPGTKDNGLLESAVHAPVRSVGGADAYPTLFTKVAALGFLLPETTPSPMGTSEPLLR